MLLLRAFKRYKEFLRKEAEVSKAMRRLATVPMDYQTLQTIADTVSSGYNVEITVLQPDGTEITIKRGTAQDQVQFETFAERYNKLHNS